MLLTQSLCICNAVVPHGVMQGDYAAEGGLSDMGGGLAAVQVVRSPGRFVGQDSQRKANNTARAITMKQQAQGSPMAIVHNST